MYLLKAENRLGKYINLLIKFNLIYIYIITYNIE